MSRWTVSIFPKPLSPFYIELKSANPFGQVCKKRRGFRKGTEFFFQSFFQERTKALRSAHTRTALGIIPHTDEFWFIHWAPKQNFLPIKTSRKFAMGKVLLWTKRRRCSYYVMLKMHKSCWLAPRPQCLGFFPTVLLLLKGSDSQPIPGQQQTSLHLLSNPDPSQPEPWWWNCLYPLCRSIKSWFVAVLKCE